jgi:hypothetical protein
MMKRNISLPVTKGKKTIWPTKALCPICEKNKVLEPHSMAIFSAGALLMNRKKKFGGSSDKMDGFLSLMWHGAHNGGKGRNREICCAVDIMRDVFGGQGELYFCSTTCLRIFLCNCVDALETKMKIERKALQQNATRYRRAAVPKTARSGCKNGG